MSSSRALPLLDLLTAQKPSMTFHMINCFRMQSDTVVVLVYVDDCIVLSGSKTALTQFIATLRFGPEKFNFTDEGSLSNYLGVNIEKLPSQSGFKMTQPFLIQRILGAAEIDTRMTKSRPTPATSLLLAKDEDVLPGNILEITGL